MNAPATQYRHQCHAGNIADVLKHPLLLLTLRKLMQVHERLSVCDLHAGAGLYQFGSTGEWSAGIERLLQHANATAPALRPYTAALQHVRAQHARRVYPGSPLLIRQALRPDDTLECCEIEEDTARALRRHLGDDRRVNVRRKDAWQHLDELAHTAPPSAPLLVVIDPTYGDKAEWTLLPRALAAAWAARPATHFFVWYPIKSYTRPNAMLNALAQAQMPHAALELITTPLALQKNRLNGSGVLWVNAPAGLLEEAVVLGPLLGEACATHGAWSMRCLGATPKQS